MDNDVRSLVRVCLAILGQNMSGRVVQTIQTWKKESAGIILNNIIIFFLAKSGTAMAVPAAVTPAFVILEYVRSAM